jgi:hypothetical protein
MFKKAVGMKWFFLSIILFIFMCLKFYLVFIIFMDYSAMKEKQELVMED